MEYMKHAVQDVVNKIYNELGEVRPSELIERAMPKESPIHDAFEWDNKKAGHEYRLIQARTWIRKVEIIIEDKVDRFVHVPLIKVEGDDEFVKGENYYKPMSVIGQDKDEFKLALSATLARLNAAKAAYNQLKDAANYTDSVERKPNFKRADKGFAMIDRALSA